MDDILVNHNFISATYGHLAYKPSMFSIHTKSSGRVDHAITFSFPKVALGRKVNMIAHWDSFGIYVYRKR